MKYRIFLLMMFFWLLLTNCDKTTNSTITVAPSLMSNFNFKPGTYWIYKDSLTGEIDSYSVYSNQTTYPGYGYNTNIETFNIYIYMYKSNNGYYYNVLTLSLTDSVIDINYAYPTFTYFAYVFVYPFSLERYSLLENSDTAGIAAIFPNYVVNNFTYNNVAQIYNSYSDTLDPTGLNNRTHHDIYYINNSQGILKMRLNHPYDSAYIHVWELVRCNIVK